MKQILTKYLALGSICMLILSACKKDDKLVTSNGGKAGTLTASTTSLVLDKTKLDDTTSVIKFNFSAASYGYSAAVTNTLQIDLPGDNWKTPTSATLGTKVYTQSYSTATFNALLLKLGVPSGIPTTVQVRIQHSLSSGVAPIYSNVVSLNVTAFNLASWLYVAGAFEGWTVPGPGVDSLLSATSNGIYTGIINFTSGNLAFKILVNSQNYTGNIGSDGTSTGITSASTQSNLNSTVTGQTIVTVNLNTNTISFAAADYYSAIGTVTPGGDYSTDDDLKFVNSIDQAWEGVLPFTYGTFPGAFKVRQNHDWGFSWGTISTPDGVSLTDASGGNIPVPASGNYKLTFTIPITVYAIDAAAATTATYTLTKQ